MLSAEFYINFFMSRTVYVIISSSLKPYQNFGPDLSPDSLLMFSVSDSCSKRPTISKQTTGILSGRARRVSGHDA